MKKSCLFVIISLFLAGCGSTPYQKGQKFAAKYDACMMEYNEALTNVGDDFARKIQGKYESRTKAIEDYLQLLRDCHQKYLEKWEKIYIEENQSREKFKTSSDRNEFENGLQSGRRFYTFALEPDLETIEIPSVVIKQIRSIIPPKPSDVQIAKDLVGHTLSEGKEKGYYPQSWTWTILEDGVSNLKVVSTQENTNSRYTVVVLMRLSSETRAYDAKAMVSYALEDIADWQIENVRSMGLDIVKTHRYDDCVKCYFSEGIAGGLIAENNCEIALEVAGKELNYSGKWDKFSHVVPPHKQSYISYNTIDFVIDYIERP